MKRDIFTLYLRRAIDTLFLSHKLRTSLGVVLGGSINGIKDLFYPYFKQFENTIDLDALGLINCIIFGITIMHAQNIFFLFKRKSPQDEKIDSILQIIEEGRKMGLNEWQVRQMYNATFLKILQNLELNEDTKEQLKKLEDQDLQSETEPGSP